VENFILRADIFNVMPRRMHIEKYGEVLLMWLYMPTKVFSEENCVMKHADALRVLGEKAMIVTGRNSAKKTGALADVLAALGDTPSIIYDRIEENPSVETIMDARALALKEHVDFFIGIGGGSPMDAAKAIALMTANPEENEDVLYTAKPLGHLPVACVPTTCGTGSEVTPYSILTRHAHQTKRSISHKIFPEIALLDAKYLKHMRRDGLVNTCVDALAHLLESYLNTNACDLNRIYSREGLAMWAQFRDRLLEDRLQSGDYERMLHASMVAGMAITHTGTSLPHGMSYPVTYALGIPHGRAVGMFLGGFVEVYQDRAAALEALAILGFESAAQFRSYMNALLGIVELDEELLKKGAAMLLEDPAKLKNYPFALSEEELLGMVN